MVGTNRPGNGDGEVVSAAALGRLVERSAALVQCVDSQGRLVHVNEAWCERLGYSREEALQLSLEAVVAPECLDPCRQVLARVMTGEVVDRVQATFLSRDGSLVLVEGSVCAEADSDPGTTLGIFRDVTDEHRTLERLRSADSFQRATLASALQMIVVTDPTGIIEGFNPAAEALTGYRAEDVIGRRSLADLVLPEELAERSGELSAELGEDVEPGFAALSMRAAGGVVEVLDWTIVRRDGEHLRALVSLSTMLDDHEQLLGFLAIVTDISEQHRTRRRLEESEAYHRAVLEAAVDAIITTDQHARILAFNPAAERMFGYTAQEVLAENVRILMPEPYHSEHDTYVRRYLETGEAKVIGQVREVTARRKDGSSLPVELAVGEVPLTDRRAFTAIVRDITRRREIERLKDQFLSVMSHELRTPLTSIRGSLRLLESGVGGALPEKQANLVRIASNNSARLVRLINDILDLEKLEVGRTEIRPEELCCRELLQAAREDLSGLAKQGGVSVTVEGDLEVRVLADRDRLLQVLVNLLGNALKFSPAGSGVVLRIRAGADAVRFEVQDAGPGIEASQQHRLFTRFHQVDGSSTRSKGGTGLGLAISRAIVEEHGGRIGLESNPGDGSTFWFELPLPRQGLEEAEKERRGGRHALVVEDDTDVARLIHSILGEIGVSVTSAPSLAAARAELQEATPHVILLDLKLPDGDGMVLLQELRVDERTRAIPVVIVSGRDPRREGFAAPAFFDWVTKPFEPSLLLGRVRAALGAEEHRPRILVVDDDADARSVLRAHLEQEGFEVLESGDGEAALATLAEAQVDLVVLDLHMPVLDGFGVIEAFRERGVSPPVLVYSGRDLQAADRSRLTRGVTRFLTKSRVDEEEFVAEVRKLLHSALEQAEPDRDEEEA